LFPPFDYVYFLLLLAPFQGVVQVGHVKVDMLSLYGSAFVFYRPFAYAVDIDARTGRQYPPVGGDSAAFLYRRPGRRFAVARLAFLLLR
jgi:hypothetical protein